MFLTHFLLTTTLFESRCRLCEFLLLWYITIKINLIHIQSGPCKILERDVSYWFESFTEVVFTSFLSSPFTAVAITVNPLEEKLTNSTSVHCVNVYFWRTSRWLRPWSNQDVGFVNFKINISMCVWFRRNTFLFRLAYQDMNLLFGWVICYD